MRYDEPRLVRKLAGLTAAGRVAFAAACAERLLPTYVAFHERTGQGDPAFLRETLASIWIALINGTAPSEIELAERIERCEAMVPSEDNDWIEQTAYAQNAAAAVAYTVRCLRTNNPQEAAWVARQAYEALDFYVINRHGIDTQQPAAEDLILGDLLIQAELKRQERDISDLTTASEGQLYQLIDQLRIRSLQESAEFFG